MSEDVNKRNPKVTVFGENVNEKEWRRHQDSGVVWGIIVLFAGILLLLNTFNIIPWSVWGVIFRYWPFILILYGLQIMMGNNSISRFVISLLSIFVFALIILLSLQTVAPELVAKLPPELLQLLKTWEGLRK